MTMKIAVSVKALESLVPLEVEQSLDLESTERLGERGSDHSTAKT